MFGNWTDYPNFAVLKGGRGEQGVSFSNVNKLGGPKGSRATQAAPLGATTSKFKAFNPPWPTSESAVILQVTQVYMKGLQTDEQLTDCSLLGPLCLLNSSSNFKRWGKWCSNTELGFISTPPIFI